MSLPTLPASLPPLPKGYVYLGLGGSFVRREFDREFWGKAYSNGSSGWCKENAWSGTCPFTHYAVPAGSEIVRLNTPKKLKKLPTMEAHVYAKPKKKAKRINVEHIAQNSWAANSSHTCFQTYVATFKAGYRAAMRRKSS